MFRHIKKLSRFFGVFSLALFLFCTGFPSALFLDVAKERNVVDVLYWALKDPNVVDRGFSELVHPHVEHAYAATFSIQTGYFIGNNSDDRAITGVGFAPQMVLLKDNTSGGNEGVQFKTASMSGELTLALSETDAALTTNSIQSLDSDGFTVGSDVDSNGANVQMFWAAFGGSDCSASGTFCVGSYTGVGTSKQITDVGFRPDLVIVKRNGASVGTWRSSSMDANTSNFFHNLTQDATGAYISGFLSNGFSVGGNASVNSSGQTYYYAAFKEVGGAMDVGKYTGNAANDRNITSSDDAGLTFQPNFVFVKNANAATAQNGVFSITEHYGDRSCNFTDAASAADQIQELRSAGGFQVGTLATVNGSGNTMYYAAFGGAVPKAAGTGSYTMKSGSYTGTGSAFSITGLGFPPDLVIIKNDTTTTQQYAVFRTSMMAGDSTAYFSNGAANFTTGITALGSDGFSVGIGSTVNLSGYNYTWTAFGNAWRPDKADGASDFLVGTYIGDGVNNRNIDRLPFRPDVLTVKRSGASGGIWTTFVTAATNVLFFAASPQATGYITALNSDGFSRGTNAAVNTAGNTYHYFAFASSSKLYVGTYNGNGTGQNITDPGFQPDLVWTKKTTGGTARAAEHRVSALTGDTSQQFVNGANFTGGFTNFIENGFSLGTNTSVNESGVFDYVAWNNKAYNQAAYRFFANTDTADVGAALANQDTAATLSSTGQAFRLRTLVRVDGGNQFANGQSFKLQYAGKGGGSCASPSGTPSSYTDVTGATAIAYNGNAPADGAALIANANDPTDGGRTIVNQTYEESNNLINSQGAITDGQDGKWDFALIDNGATASATYCFRLVKSDGTELETYGSRPEITMAAGGNATPSVSAVSVDSGAASVTLIEGTTKDVSCAGTVTDTDGYTDIDSVQGIFFRTSVGTSSADDANNKYTRAGDAQCVPSGGSGNTENYACTFPVQYFADPTDAGSPNASDTWTCEMRASDGTATSTAGTDTIEMNSLVALSVDASIDYGTLAPLASNIGESVTLTNTGNRDMDPEVSGANLTSGLNTISVGQERYKTSTFSSSCTEGTQLSGTPATVNLSLPQRTNDATPVTSPLYWCLTVPNGSRTGAYEGTNTFSAVAGI